MTLSDFVERGFKLSNYDNILELSAHGDKIIMRTIYAIYIIEDDPMFNGLFVIKQIAEIPRG